MSAYDNSVCFASSRTVVDIPGEIAASIVFFLVVSQTRSTASDRVHPVGGSDILIHVLRDNNH